MKYNFLSIGHEGVSQEKHQLASVTINNGIWSFTLPFMVASRKDIIRYMGIDMSTNIETQLQKTGKHFSWDVMDKTTTNNKRQYFSTNPAKYERKSRKNGGIRGSNFSYISRAQLWSALQKSVMSYIHLMGILGKQKGEEEEIFRISMEEPRTPEGKLSQSNEKGGHQKGHLINTKYFG